MPGISVSKAFFLFEKVINDAKVANPIRMGGSISKCCGPNQKRLKGVEVDGLVLSGIHKHDRPRFLGFAFPFAVLMSLPLVGAGLLL